MPKLLHGESVLMRRLYSFHDNTQNFNVHYLFF